MVPPGGAGEGDGREDSHGSQEEKDEVSEEGRSAGPQAEEETVAVNGSLDCGVGLWGVEVDVFDLDFGAVSRPAYRPAPREDEGVGWDAGANARTLT